MTADIRGKRGNRSHAQDFATDATAATGRPVKWRGPSKDRPVRPRRNVTQRPLPIIAVDNGQILLERDGALWPIDQLSALVITEPSSIFVAHNVSLLVKRLDTELDDNLRWQLRASPLVREVYGVDRQQCRVQQMDTVISFFGFRPEYVPGSKRKVRTPSKYHYPIDPLLFARRSVRDMTGSEKPSLLQLMEWAQDVRDFAIAQGLVIRPTSGGFAAQLLRDRRFYPEDRRKVPKATNAKARELLPGNHYRLNCDTTRAHAATYLDQVSAHHTIASELPLPDANSLYAKGRFRKPGERRAWAKPHTELFRKTLEGHGLIYAKVTIPFIARNEFPPPWMDKPPGKYFVYLYTNEIADFLALGGSFEYLIAAWTSDHRDTGLNTYAKWALAQLAKAEPERVAWLKPTLLSTYGILASKPRQLEIAFKRAKGGDPVEYPIAGGTISLQARRTNAPVEMSTANVIHRGMIEAETRARSLRLARELAAQQIEVLAVYADSVFVKSDKPLPLLPDTWTVQSYLTRLRFLNEVSFVSNEMTKLPGVPREHRHLAGIRKHGRMMAEHANDRRRRDSVRRSR